jgi:hypothetical protein
MATELNFSEQALTDSQLEEVLGQNQDLTILDIRNTAVTDAGLSKARGSKIQVLRLKGAGIGDTGLEHLKGLGDLRELVLEGTGAPVSGATALHRLINLSGTQLTDGGLAHIKDYPKIERLDLTGNRLTDAGLEHLKGHPSLRYVCLDHTKVTAAGVEGLRRSLPQCEVVWKTTWTGEPTE